MSISMYEASIPVCIRALTNLRHVLEKGEASALARRIDPSVLLQSRLAPDMFPLIRQVQICSDTAKGAGARLAGIEIPRFEDTEQGFADLYERLQRTIAFLESIDRQAVDGSAGRTVVLKLPSEELHFTGMNYLLGFVIPNLAFHVTTAYNILRHNGVDIGKRDYLGAIPQIRTEA